MSLLAFLILHWRYFFNEQSNEIVNRICEQQEICCNCKFPIFEGGCLHANIELCHKLGCHFQGGVIFNSPRKHSIPACQKFSTWLSLIYKSSLKGRNSVALPARLLPLKAKTRLAPSFEGQHVYTSWQSLAWHSCLTIVLGSQMSLSNWPYYRCQPRRLQWQSATHQCKTCLSLSSPWL